MGEGMPPLGRDKSAAEIVEKRNKRELGLGILETFIRALEGDNRKKE